MHPPCHPACPGRRALSSPLYAPLVVLLCGLALLPAAAAAAPAEAQLALAQGCNGCHGAPPRPGVPGWTELAERYARYRDQPEAPQRLAEQLRSGALGRIAAHARLGEADAAALMRWLIEGARPE